MSEKKSKKTCFVVGPIGEADSDTRQHADWFLHEIVEHVFSEFPEFSVIRADTMSQPGLITSQLINHLLDAELVIADMSFMNPNAFYEIGIRHMAQKPIIHAFLRGTEIPFDVKPYRAIEFGYSKPQELTTARKNLKEAVMATIASEYIVENPVTAARGKFQLEQHATPEIKLIWDQLEKMQNELHFVLGPLATKNSRLEHNYVFMPKLAAELDDLTMAKLVRKTHNFMEKKLHNNRYNIGWLDNNIVLSADHPVDKNVIEEFNVLLDELARTIEP